MKKVVITGATGFVGTPLVKRLLDRGYQVSVLTRNIPKAALALGPKPEFFHWDPMADAAPKAAFQGAMAVINLMGENIASKRWTEEQKKKIYDSRIVGTKNLIDGMVQSGVKVESFISTSAIGVYGNHPKGEEIFEETPVDCTDFLCNVCHDWEAVVNNEIPKDSNVRTCILRVGIVLDRTGGAIAKMLTPFKMGVGGIMGSGRQFMSWIHRSDLVNLYIHALENTQVEGIVNATAPRPVSNKVFTKTMGRVLKRPTLLPMPETAARLAFGEMSVILVEGQKVIPRKALNTAFKFKFEKVEDALKNILDEKN